MGVVDLGGGGDGVAVGDLGRAAVSPDVELAHTAVDDDLKVKLAHILDDDLAGVLIATEAEGR